MSKRRHNDGRSGAQHLGLGLHNVRARLLRHRVEPGHDKRGRLHSLPSRHLFYRRLLHLYSVSKRRHNDGRSGAQHLGLGLHNVRARLLRHRVEPGHDKRGRLHGLPSRHLLFCYLWRLEHNSMHGLSS